MKAPRTIRRDGKGLPGRLCRFSGTGGLARIGKVELRPESGISKAAQFLCQSGDGVAFSTVR